MSLPNWEKEGLAHACVTVSRLLEGHIHGLLEAVSVATEFPQEHNVKKLRTSNFTPWSTFYLVLGLLLPRIFRADLSLMKPGNSRRYHG